MPTSPLPPASEGETEEHVIVRMARLLTSNLPENTADVWLIELMLAGAIRTRGDHDDGGHRWKLPPVAGDARGSTGRVRSDPEPCMRSWRVVWQMGRLHGWRRRAPLQPCPPTLQRFPDGQRSRDTN